MAREFNDRAWLVWLGKVRIIIITFLLGIQLAVAVLTPTVLPKRLFVSVILLWYTLSVFYLLLLSLWAESRFQARLQVLTDLAMATALVYVTGGIDSSFNFLYPLVIIVASILLPRAWAFMTAGLAFIASGATMELAYFDVIRSYSAAHPDLRSLQAAIFINLFAYVAIAYLSSRLAAKLRAVDTQLQDKSGALENLQALHENIVDSISGVLIVTGLDGRISVINAAGQRALQRSAAEVMGKPVQELFLDRLPDVGDQEARCEVRCVTPSGKYKTFSLARTTLEVPDRGAMGFVYTLDDLTEIRRLEREVRLRDRLAAVGRMAAAIAHEIRNPLSSIAGSVKVLSDVSVLDQEQRTLVDIVTRESERLNNIISDFLMYSREKEYKFATTDLVPLLEDTLALLENRLPSSGEGAPGEAAEGGRIHIVRRFEVEQAFALADGDRMKQVFWNICDNALRAMPQGGTLTVSLQASNERWIISFADTGRGLARQEKEKIFEPFQSDFQGGTGLGLAIVYQIVQAHDGKIFVRSMEGKGTEFSLQLRQALTHGSVSAAEKTAEGKRSAPEERKVMAVGAGKESRG